MILTFDICDHCNREPKSILHALWDYTELAQIWDALLEFDFHRSHCFSNISNLILYAQREGKNMEKLAMLLWTIWYCRNQIKVKNSDYPISQVAPTAQQALQGFSRANLKASSQIFTHSPTQVKWSPPPPNSLKVNFDGATFKNIGRAGLGVVVCDSQGQALALLPERVPLPFSSDLVEASHQKLATYPLFLKVIQNV